MRLGKLGMASLDGSHGGTEIKPLISTVRQHEIFSAAAAPNLAGNEVIITAATEGAVPGLDYELKFFRHLTIEANPLALDDAAIERCRSLLVLSVESPATHADTLAIQKRLRQAGRPEQVIGFYVYLFFGFGKLPGFIFRSNRRQAHMLPAGALTPKNMPRQIKFMQTLHNDELDACSRIIDAAAKRSIK